MDLSQKSDVDILLVANPIMDNLMNASTAIDYLSQFDKVDRYDYNHNGNFNEPDG